MANQPIPFKPRSADPEGAPPRPPGEVGGHTVQPWEQDAVPPTTSPNSKDVPPPEAGAPEAAAAGPGRGAATTRAPGNAPSETPGTVTTTDPPLSTNPGGEEGGGPAGVHGADAASRPPRPPVYSPQAGHEPAPRPPASHRPPTGLGTDGDRLVEAITRAIAENIGKAFHQSVAQAVREVMPLSGRTVDRGAPTALAKPRGTTASTAPTASTTGAMAPVAMPGPVAKPEALPEGPPGRSPTETPQPAAAKPATDRDPSAPGPYGAGAQPSQYGGTIEAPDQDAVERAKRADGGPAAAAADAGKRKGELT